MEKEVLNEEKNVCTCGDNCSCGDDCHCDENHKCN